jgi:hypothetical protein
MSPAVECYGVGRSPITIMTEQVAVQGSLHDNRLDRHPAEIS